MRALEGILVRNVVTHKSKVKVKECTKRRMNGIKSVLCVRGMNVIMNKCVCCEKFKKAHKIKLFWTDLMNSKTAHPKAKSPQ